MPQYNGVWTLEAQAQAQSNQQWVTDPNFKNTTLLLQADGTGSGSQNQTFLDGSTNNFFITRNGNTTQGSFSPFSQAPGYWSNYFDGSGDYISMPSATSALALGSGDWTVECFVNLANYSDNRTLIDIYDGDSSVRFIWRILTTGLLAFQGASGATRTSTTTTVPTNQWVHLAICKASGTTRIFINGIQSNTNYTDTNTYTNSGASAIGIISSDFSSSPFLGYISNFRVVKGTALYAANFNPPTSTLTAVTNTSLLTCQSNRFIDNSTSALTLTLGGTPSVQAFAPFAPALQWTPDVVGGSGYFDGTSDYLSLASNANLTPASSTYTFECWVYRTASGAMTIWDTSVTNGFYIHINGSNKIVLRSYGTADIITSSLDAPVNAWFNLVIARGAANSTKMWINGSSTSGGSATDSTTYVAATTYIGIYDGSTVPLTGYIAGMRLVKGSDVYGVSNSTITIPTAPPTAITNTQFLANFTNAGIYDGKMANNLETVGNAQVATSPVKYGSGSMYFDGTGDSLSIPANPIFNLGSSDFTIEFWLYPPSASYGAIMYSTNNGSKTDVFAIYSYGSGQSPANSIVALATASGGGAWSLFNNQSCGLTRASAWQHVAIVRNGSVIRGYLNGVVGFTTTSSSAVASFNGFSIASNGASGDYFTGYIDDLRITRAARYYENFTPPQQALPRQ
jgi:hypothetical protein